MFDGFKLIGCELTLSVLCKWFVRCVSGSICGPPKKTVVESEESDALMPSDTEPLVGHEDLAVHIPDSVSHWTVKFF